MTKQRILLIGLLAAILILGASIINAQSSASGSFTGTIDVFNDSLVLVSGVAFSLNGTDIDPDLALASGTPVTVDYILSGGAFSATRLTLPSTAERGIGKVSGSVDLTNGMTIIVGGLAFNAAGADIASDSVFKVGELVDVEFSVNGGVFVVTELAPYDQKRGIIVGTVDAIEPPQITIGGVTFDASEAEVDDSEFELALDALVKLEFGIEPDGIVRAYAIQVRMPASVTVRSGDTGRVIVAGVVEEKSEVSLTIAGVTVDTTEARVDELVTIGLPARVTFRRSVDKSGPLTPVRVRPLDDLDDLDEVIDTTYGDDDDDDDSSSDDSAASCTLPSGWTTYTVRRGDTLGRIANAANSSASELVTANCLASANLIFVGQVLFVPNAVNSGPGSSDDSGSDDDNDGSDDDGTDDQGGGNDDSNDDSGSDDDGTDDQGGGNDDSGSDDGSDDSDDSDDDDGDDD